MAKWYDQDDRPTVLLITPWYGGSAGGVAVSSETIAGTLQRSGTRVIVLVLNSQTPQTGRFGELVLPLISYDREVRRSGVKGWFGYWRRLFSAGLLLFRLKSRHRALVAHFQYCIPAYAPLRICCRLLRVPVIITFHGSDINECEAGTCEAEEVSAMIHDASAVTAVSEGLLAALHSRFPESRGNSSVVRNAVPLDLWESNDASSLNDCRDIDVLYLGNIEPIKGPDLLLDAFSRLLERRPATSLYFVGSGVMEQEVRSTAARLGLAERVTFAGRAKRADVGRWLRRARILALPSRAEGLPLVSIEAQLMGVPVVGHQVGGVPQAIVDGRTGLLVSLGDADAFATALERLLSDDREWLAFSERARDWAKTRFDPTQMARRYAEVYARVSGSVRAPVPAPAPASDSVQPASGIT
jgi:glycosyltransferase involved in cell wall biosynthesis